MVNPVAKAMVVMTNTTKILRSFQHKLNVSDQRFNFSGSTGNSFAITTMRQHVRIMDATVSVAIVMGTLENGKK